MDKLRLRDDFPYSIVRNAPYLWDIMGVQGRYFGELLRTKKSGNLILKERFPIDFHNLVMNAAKTYMFDAAFNAATQVSTWYLGLIDATSFSTIAATDTMTAHAGWIEFGNYTAGVRQTWNKGATSGNTITGTTVSQFTINANGTLAGGFLTTNNTIGGTTGLLWSAGQFPTAAPVSITDVFRINYSVSS
jgi:hypothetical protein